MTNKLEQTFPAGYLEPVKPMVITICCGTEDHVLEKKVSADAARGLAIHPDTNNENIFVITHVASGKKICEALNRETAGKILTELLTLDADWLNPVPWESEAQARELKRQISVLWQDRVEV